jgi:hypothetical protein
METHRLVLPANLNHYGFLFGGQLLAWIDEASWIAASASAMDASEGTTSYPERTPPGTPEGIIRSGRCF